MKNRLNRHLLKSFLEIKTSFGGGFVNKIEGIPQKEEGGYSWFFYVNGLMSEVGAGSFKLKDKDEVLWDYHDYKNYGFSKGIIGMFPRPFINNDYKTYICVSNENLEEVKELKDFFTKKGVKEISIETFPCKDLDKDNLYKIVIGKWEEVIKLSIINDMYSYPKKTGFRIKFNKEKECYLEDKNTKKVFYKNSFSVLSLLDGRVWLITAKTKDKVKEGISFLVKKNKKIRNLFGAIVEKNQVINVY